MKTFLVETISLVKRSYLVQAKSSTHATDTIVCGEATPSHIEQLDEVISGCRSLKKTEVQNTISIGNVSSAVPDRAVNAIDYEANKVHAPRDSATEKMIDAAITHATLNATPPRY